MMVRITILLLFCHSLSAQTESRNRTVHESGMCTPGAILTNDTTLCEGDTLQLSSSPALSYSWYPSNGISDTAIQNPTLIADSSRTYFLSTTTYSAVNLVSNGDFESGNTGFTSNLTYSPDLFPASTYYITTNPQLTHPAFSPCIDHTSGTGNMMVVNGAVTPNVVVWSTTISVSPNTDYAFSAWVTNVSPFTTDLPLLQFSINSTTVGPVFSTLPTQCSWNQFYEIWNSGSNTVANITLLNQNTTGSGNDFALDDIEFGEIITCLDSIMIEVTPTEALSVSISTTTNPVCEEDTAFFTATVTNGGTNPRYEWYVNGVLMSGVISCQVLTSGLVACYPFNGNANDESGSGIHGTVYGATLTTDRFGSANSAYQFNGINQYIKMAADGLPATSRTVSMWFNATSLDTHPVTIAYGGISCGETWFQGINHGGQQDYMLEGHCEAHHFDYLYPSAPIGEWYHWVITTDPAGCRMYVNGLQVAQNNHFVDNTYVAGKDMAVGVCVTPWGTAPYTDSQVGYFQGKLDDIRLYNRALSATEIWQLYTTGDSTFSYVPSNGDTIWCVVTSYDPSVINNPDTSNYIITTVNPKPNTNGIWHQ